MAVCPSARKFGHGQQKIGGDARLGVRACAGQLSNEKRILQHGQAVTAESAGPETPRGASGSNSTASTLARHRPSPAGLTRLGANYAANTVIRPD